MRVFAVSFNSRHEPISVIAPNAKCALDKALKKAKRDHPDSPWLGWQLHDVTGIELEVETTK